MYIYMYIYICTYIYIYIYINIYIETPSHQTLDWELFSFPPLFASVLISIQGAESPGSGRMGVICAIVSFSPIWARLGWKPLSLAGPSSALRHWDVVAYSEAVDSVHARTCPHCDNTKKADMVDLHYSPEDCYYRRGLSIRVSMFEHVDRGLRPLTRSPGMGEGGDW